MNRVIRIFSLTTAGQQLAVHLRQRLSAAAGDVVHSANPKPFAAAVQAAFCRGEALLLICATGIAVRTLAPVLVDKKTDPPVLVLDERGQFVIPLLSGHEGGANDWAQQIATLLSAQLVMTTARSYLQPIYTVGMGCERHCPQAHLYELLQHTLAQAGLPMAEVHSLNSIDLKADELGLMQLASQLARPFQTFNKDELSTVEPWLSTRSDYVFNTVGVYGVAESAALYAAKLANPLTATAPELVQTKLKTNKATCAIARSYRE